MTGRFQGLEITIETLLVSEMLRSNVFGPQSISSDRQLHLQIRQDVYCYFILQSKDVFQIPIVVLCPEVISGERVDQLGRDPKPIARPLDTPLRTYRTPNSSLTCLTVTGFPCKSRLKSG